MFFIASYPDTYEESRKMARHAEKDSDYLTDGVRGRGCRK